MNYYRILEPDELMHYGVKGMRWGKRKAYQTAYTNEAGRRFITTAEGKVIPIATNGRQTNVTGQGKGLYRRGEAIPDSKPNYDLNTQIKKGAKLREQQMLLKIPLRDESKKWGQASWDEMQKNNRRKENADYYRGSIRENQEAIKDNGKDPRYAANTAYNRTRAAVNQRKLANVENAIARSSSSSSSSASSSSPTKKKKTTGPNKMVTK